jgi:hypothetical protein
VTPSDYQRIIGVAWSEGDSENAFNYIRVAVGMNHGALARGASAQAQKIANLETRLSSLERMFTRMSNENTANTVMSLETFQNDKQASAVASHFIYDVDRMLDGSYKESENSGSPVDFMKLLEDNKKGNAPLPQVRFPNMREIEEGYNVALKHFVESGNNIEENIFFKRMESDQMYKEIMLNQMKRFLDTRAVNAAVQQTKSN